jgi:5-methylcytosine-specific restriction endonuclease McrBC GTP-binding regulatory subunit McrB
LLSYKKEIGEGKKNEEVTPYVFFIYEINRGDISKIFGELFFSIESGYRGKNGKVKTQYANLQEVETTFDEEDAGYFYIPQNVYIIGTMNDIDRSVESMDFAMRRRFTFIEIKSEQSAENMNLNHDQKAYMKRLNNAIFDKDKGSLVDLSSSYHI